MASNSGIQNGIWVDERLATLNSGIEWQPDISRGLARLRERQSGWRHGKWIWTAVAAAVACVIVAALPQPRVFAHYCFDCTVALWQNFSGFGPTAAGMKLEQPRTMAPDFTLNDATGKAVQLASFKGRVVLLNFWATWCHGCKIEIPWFIEFERKYRNGGFEVIGVSMDDDGWKSVTPYVEEKNLNYLVVIGNDQLRTLYGLSSMPMTLLIDRDGKVATSHTGLVKKGDYQREIETMLKEKR
jgi:peroxiredoxin